MDVMDNKTNAKWRDANKVVQASVDNIRLTLKNLVIDKQSEPERYERNRQLAEEIFG